MWNPVKELKVRWPPGSAGRQPAVWNPVKELKDAQISSYQLPLPIQWNPVKELKGLGVLELKSVVRQAVESGEGIESGRWAADSNSPRSAWNPVKELKVASKLNL